jgi:PAS domain S-box-containing protein
MLETELFALLERTADAAYSVTEGGEICSWNQAAERLFGYPAEEVLGRNIDDVLEARDALGTSAVAGGVQAGTRRWDGATGGIDTFDLQARTRDGRRIWVNVSTIIHDHPRSGRRLFARLVRDVDQRRRNEELVHRVVDAARHLVSLTEETAHHAPVDPLSDQERRILKLFATGRNATSIARKLNISPQTLRNHLHHINRKLRTHNRLEAVTHAQRRGLID